jgi:hypothetical protein
VHMPHAMARCKFGGDNSGAARRFCRGPSTVIPGRPRIARPVRTDMRVRRVVPDYAGAEACSSRTQVLSENGAPSGRFKAAVSSAFASIHDS